MKLLLFGLGFWEILVIALLVLILFGANKIPELMRGLGRGVQEFKKGINSVEEAVTDAKDDLASDKKNADEASAETAPAGCGASDKTEA